MLICYLIVAILFSCTLSPESVEHEKTNIMLWLKGIKTPLCACWLCVCLHQDMSYHAVWISWDTASSSPGIHTMLDSSNSLYIYTHHEQIYNTLKNVPLNKNSDWISVGWYVTEAKIRLLFEFRKAKVKICIHNWHIHHFHIWVLHGNY